MSHSLIVAWAEPRARDCSATSTLRSIPRSNLTHQIVALGLLEVCAVHVHAARSRRDQRGTIDVPYVVRNRIGAIQAASAEAPLSKMFQSGRHTEDRIPAGVQGGHAIREVGDAFAVTLAYGLAALKDIVVNVRRYHQQLVDETHQQRTIFARPGVFHGVFQDVIAHAVRDERSLGLTCLRGVSGCLRLLRGHPIIKSAQHIGEIVGRPGALRASIGIIAQRESLSTAK